MCLTNLFLQADDTDMSIRIDGFHEQKSCSGSIELVTTIQSRSEVVFLGHKCLLRSRWKRSMDLFPNHLGMNATIKHRSVHMVQDWIYWQQSLFFCWGIRQEESHWVIPDGLGLPQVILQLHLLRVVQDGKDYVWAYLHIINELGPSNPCRIVQEYLKQCSILLPGDLVLVALPLL